jgi:hypothetical protein
MFWANVAHLRGEVARSTYFFSLNPLYPENAKGLQLKDLSLGEPKLLIHKR